MADLIKLKGGSVDMPTLQDREPAYHKKEEALYIGTEGGNVRLCGANDISVLNARLDVLTARLDAMSALIDNITARLDAMGK